MPLAELALYAAVRGDDGSTRTWQLDEVLARAPGGGPGGPGDGPGARALGERELVAGRYAEAVHHLEQMVTPPLVHLAGPAPARGGGARRPPRPGPGLVARAGRLRRGRRDPAGPGRRRVRCRAAGRR